MKRLTKIYFAAAVALVVAVAWGVSSEQKNENRKVAQKMTEKMKTVCVGRFLIDLPVDAHVEFSSARVEGIDINVWPAYDETKFIDEIAKREQVLITEKNEYDRPSLEKKIDVNALNFKATVMYFGREKPLPGIAFGKPVPGEGEAISVEAYGLHENLLFNFKGNDQILPRSENTVLSLIKSFEARSGSSIPDQPGFCTENGLIHDDDKRDSESITVFASLKGHPDVAIRFDTTVNGDQIADSLLLRDSRNTIKQEHPFNFKSFQRQRRTLNGIQGEEVLDRVKEFNGTSAHIFMWEGQGKAADLLAPALALELETGKGRPGEPVNSSLSDEAVLLLWDKITSSIRLRPTSSKTQAGQATPKQQVALGELVATGNPCPETGYWQCSEPGSVEGGQRQFFRQGDVMPQAVLRGTGNLWQKVSGNLPSHRVTTVWKLVAHAATTEGTSRTDAPGPENGEV